LQTYRIQHPGFFALTLFSLTILLLITGSFLTATYLSHRYTEQFQEEVKLIIELRTGTAEKDRELVIEELKNAGGVIPESIEFISREQALEEMRMQMDDDVVLKHMDNPFADMLRFSVAATHFNAASIDSLKLRIEALAPVSAMHHPAGMYDPVFSLLRRAQAVGAAVIILLVFMCGILIHHLMRLSIIAQRKQIRTMQLVGGHPAFIRRPYVRQALQMALFAWSVAGILCLAAVFFIAGLTRNTLSPAHLTIGAVILLILALSVCIGSTWVAVTRMLEQA
jgi:cell division transport system permease protein